MRLRPAEIDLKSAKLTPEEGYVLSRLDGPIEASQIAAVTGLPAGKVDEIVRRLVAAGVLIPEGEQTPSMIPSVPPGAQSSIPADGGLGDVMIPSAAALPEIGPGGLPPGASSLDDWAAGLPPGVAPLAEPLSDSELPPGVTSLSPEGHGSDLPEGVTSLAPGDLPEGVTSLAPDDLPEGVTSLAPDDLPDGVASLDPAGAPVSLEPGVLRDAVTRLEPISFGAPSARLPTGAADFVAPSRPHSSSPSGRWSSAPASASGRSRPAPQPSEVPSARALPEGVLPSLEGRRVLPAGVPDIFAWGDDDPKADAAPPPGAAAVPPSSPDSASPPKSEPPTSSSLRALDAAAPSEGDARKLYAAHYRALDSSEKVRVAKTATEPDLSALCFDGEPVVIGALLGNPHVGLGHARLMALHHHTGVGLEMIVRRGDLFRDNQVQRNLLRNPQVPEPVLQRCAHGKRLQELYLACIDRDFPENVRAKLRAELRRRFTTGNPEEKAEVVMRSEGRVLHLLSGCNFDGKTTQILCGRTFSSAVLIQNLAKFPAAPPALLAKVVQQPFVSRQPGLKNLLLRHPNMPGDIKRRL